MPQYLGGIDPRSQTEDLGDDPVGATTYALQNMRRVVPNIVSWTTTAGEDYADLREIYGETVGMWRQYMGHVATVIGGMTFDAKTSDQAGAVYAYVPRARQQSALQFLGDNAFRTPSWLEPDAITMRIGPSSVVANAQVAILSGLLTSSKLGRMADAAAASPATAWAPADFLASLRRMLFAGAVADANQRELQRAYLERLTLFVNPPAPTAGAAGGGGGTGTQMPASPLLVPVNVPRSDLPAVARAELRAVRTGARGFAGATTDATMRAHWLDLADRVDEALDPVRAR